MFAVLHIAFSSVLCRRAGHLKSNGPVGEELRAEGQDGALEVLAVMRSLDDERDPVSQDNNFFLRGVDHAKHDGDGAFSPSRALYNSPA